MGRLSEIANTPIPRERVLVTLGAVSVLGLAQTWGSVPWSWGFPITYVCMLAVMRVVGRSRNPEVWLAYRYLPVMTVGVLANAFYGRNHSWSGSIEVGSVFGLSMVIGLWIGSHLRIAAPSSEQSSQIP